MALAGPLVSEAAPAKINLALHVTGQQANGYHSLESLAVFTAFGDTVEVVRAPRDAFTIEGPLAARAPYGKENLVLRARDLLRDVALERDRRERERNSPFWALFARSGRKGASAGDTLRWWATEVSRTEKAHDAKGGPVGTRLCKHLPVASGMGGGSSDAAAALRALDRVWNLELSVKQLARLGERLGADVAMCVYARPLLARGVGEQIETLAGFPALDVVLANPGVAVSTPAVFKALWNKQNAPLPPLTDVRTAAALCAWLRETRNDLEAPATSLAPIIVKARAALDATGALFSRMSGSGATCFGLFGSAERADAAATALRHSHPSWWVQATRTLPSLPASPKSETP